MARRARRRPVPARDRAGGPLDRGDARASGSSRSPSRQLKAGLSYRDLLAGLFLAGIRNIKPRPVGFKFHAVMVINSAHLLGQTAAVDERLLPLFWALDNFKGSQAQDVKEGRLDPRTGSTRPGCRSRTRREAASIKAMDAWDSDAADVAAAALARRPARPGRWRRSGGTPSATSANIGHKAIFAAQCWRTLQTIGWPHAEPVLRSLAFGMLDLQGDTRPVAVGPYEANLATPRRSATTGPRQGPTPARPVALLATIRHADPEAASAEAARLLNRGRRARVALGRRRPRRQRVAAAEPGHRRPARRHRRQRPALHLQRQRRRHHPQARPAPGRRLAPAVPRPDQAARRPRPRRARARRPRRRRGTRPSPRSSPPIGRDRRTAARKALGYLERGGSADLLFAAARRMIFHKGRDSHDYKYGAAVWEECLLASDPRWQAPIAAAAMAYLPGPATPDSPLMKRAREAVAGAVWDHDRNRVRIASYSAVLARSRTC